MYFGIIYKATNLRNGKMYIGQTTDPMEERKRRHISSVINGDDTVFYRAIRKYGEENFNWCIIGEAYSKDELDDKERFWIAYYNTYIHAKKSHGYNMTLGGDGSFGFKHTNESKEKMSKLQRKRLSNKENHPMFKKHHTDRARFKISKARKGVYCGENHPWYNRKHTEESKQKMRESSIGMNKGADNYQSKPIVKLTLKGEFVERFETIRDGAKSVNGKHSAVSRCCSEKGKSYKKFIWMYEDDYNENNVKVRLRDLKIIRNHSRQVIQLTLNGEFVKKWDYIKEASIALGVNDGSIVMCCKGKRTNAYGYIWLYAEDYEKYINGEIKIEPKKQSNKKDVIALDKDYNFICKYVSMRQASIELNVDGTVIGRHCKNGGKSVYKGKFRFMFEEDYLMQNRE
ncbi:NUMOD3 domain-containing DNA-binding protein [Neobacillus sp. LXY-1]|uniref:NUMOD3 domain-containing DNA-binding protein n=1 Tax=Neobacillus sp. LXY-1 TaxID=3379133 RepID=UPI003EE258F0